MPTIPPRTSIPTNSDVQLDALRDLRKQAVKLNELTDHAAKVVQAVEAFLSEKCSIGLNAVCRIEKLCDSEMHCYLEYRRVGAKFRIAVVQADENGVDREIKAWSDTPRETKLEAFSKLPNLLVILSKQVAEVVAQTELSIRQVEKTLHALSEM